MRLKEGFGLILLAFCLSGCATGGAMSYVISEYGSPESKGSVDVGSNPAEPEMYNVWIHKTKQKIMAQPNAGAASAAGVAYAATLGSDASSPPQTKFRVAAEKFLLQQRGQGCSVSNPTKIHEIVWEFDYSCGSPVQQPAPSPSRPR